MMEVNLSRVPEDLVLAILNSSVNHFNSPNWIYSNTLFVGKEYDFLKTGDVKWFDTQLRFPNGDWDDYNEVRLFQVVCIPALTNDIIMTENDAFNVMKCVYSPSEVPYQSGTLILDFIKVAQAPVKAHEVKICLINSLHNITSDIIDAILLNYFKDQRYLCKDDIFSVDVNKYLPELKLTTGNSGLDVIYCKVCEIVGPAITDNTRNATVGYLIDNTISLYQLSSQNSFLPPIMSVLNPINNSIKEEIFVKDFLKPLIPNHLIKYAEKLKQFFQPFMVCKLEELQLKPMFVVNGPVGCGKLLLLKNTAKMLGLQYWQVECSGLISGPSGFNEAKLKSVFTRVKKLIPCLLHLNNIEALIEDREGNEDIRVISCFNKLLTELRFDYPLIIVGTTSCVEKLSSELLQSILHIIDIERPSLTERADALSWLCQLPEPTALKLAARTSGFNLCDLTFLVTQTFREKYKLTEDETKITETELEFEDFLVIIDRMNAQTASAIGAPQVPTVAWTDVGGHNEIKKEIVRSLNTANLGTGLRRSGILLWGPPGTGKTLLAKAVATECRSTFLSVKGPELLNMYIGQSEQNVRQVFERAREAAPCIIFFDELDSLAPNRGKSDSAGVMDRVVSQLLSEMDGLQRNEGVFVLGATNRPDLIDPALLRPGRLDKMLYVGPCEGTEAKLSVLKALTRKFSLNPDVNLTKIAEELPSSLTGADLYSVCYNAWQNAARTVIRQIESGNAESSETVTVSAEDFNVAVNLAQAS